MSPGRHVALVLVMLAVALSVSAGEDPPLPEILELSWLAGAWQGVMGDATIEEHWLEPVADSMLGVNRTVANGKMVGFELLRIAVRDQDLYYLASPGGRHPPTAFRLVDLGDARAVFENPEHDFPQRITYWRDGDTLHARIEGSNDGRPQAAEWHWQLIH